MSQKRKVADATMQESTQKEEKEKTLRHMVDMFCDVKEDVIRSVCEQNKWIVDNCVDKLISTQEETQRVRQLILQGAIPKYTNINSDECMTVNRGKRMTLFTNNNNNHTTNNNMAQNNNNASFNHSDIRNTKNNVNSINNLNNSRTNNKRNGNNNYKPTNNKASHSGPDASAANKEQRIGEHIAAGLRIMVLMRGLPGSGKSHLALSLVKQWAPLNGGQYSVADFVFGTDDYFFNVAGQYHYRREFLSQAHDWNQKRVSDLVKKGWSPIFVDNTNTQIWEMVPYVKMALANGYMVQLLEPSTSWRNSVAKLAACNRHSVPQDKIQHMLNRYDRCTADDLIKMVKNSKTVHVPQLRALPPVVMPIDVAAEPDVETDELFKIGVNADGFDFATMQPTPPNTERNSAADAWTAVSQVTTQTPKTQRPEIRRRIAAARMHAAFANQMSDENNAAAMLNEKDKEPDALDELEQLRVSTSVWQPFEQEHASYWNTPQVDAELTTQLPSTTKETHSLLNLLQEGIADVASCSARSQSPTFSECAPQELLKFDRHTIDCINENKKFVSLRQIYPNKNIASLWDLFVKCNGDVKWAVDILLKEDELARGFGNFSTDSVYDDDFKCVCAAGVGELLTGQKPPPPSSGELAHRNAQGPPSAKSRFQRGRSQRANLKPRNMEQQGLKDAIEQRFVLTPYSHAHDESKGRNFRHNGGIARKWLGKAIANTATQTDLVDDTTIADADECSADKDDLFEVTLGENLVDQLKTIFETDNEYLMPERLPDPRPLKVFMPRSLGKELYLLWLEAVYNHLEEQRQQTLREDKEFARLLHHSKYENCMQSPSNIRELLDMEMAWMMYNSENVAAEVGTEAWRRPGELVQHITQIKLCELFPHIPPDTLLDIYFAHNKTFSETVEVLRSSMTFSESEQPDMSNLTHNKLIERAKRENKMLQQRQLMPSVHPLQGMNGNNSPLNVEDAKRIALRNFEEQRNWAVHHCQLKAECFQKAKDAIQKGNPSIALYYSDIAELHKMKSDMYNQRAANYIMEVHKYTQNNPDLLDLHYLHVFEAVACLDIFLDRHIKAIRLTPRPYKHIFIITGRGLHSAGGVSTIKNRVKARLKDRGLRWSEVNPGLLKIKIFSASRFAKSVP